MDKKTAMNIFNNVSAVYQGSRADHAQILEALNYVNANLPEDAVVAQVEEAVVVETTKESNEDIVNNS